VSVAVELRGAARRWGASGLGPTDLALPAGRTTALVGPSGCGKSTLLRLIMGLIAPDAGEVRVGGERVEPERVELRRRMGYVIQDGGLFPHLTAGQNVTLVARHRRWPRARIEARLAELVELTRLPRDTLGRYPTELSGGQRQRVGLMRALMMAPDLLLLDEPLGALDPIIRAELQADLRRIFRALATTVVVVTHDLAEAAFLGDQIVLLRDGHVVQTGTLDELVTRPAEPFVTQFIFAQRALPIQVG
jgi:osmoprotectant transport system ATP-binding protein